MDTAIDYILYFLTWFPRVFIVLYSGIGLFYWYFYGRRQKALNYAALETWEEQRQGAQNAQSHARIQDGSFALG